MFVPKRFHAGPVRNRAWGNDADYHEPDARVYEDGPYTRRIRVPASDTSTKSRYIWAVCDRWSVYNNC